MNARDALKAAMHMPDYVWRAYIDDLSDAELMHRAAPDINHLKWQLGHLIASEHRLVESVCPGTMPALPEGFAERYGKETATSDNAEDFDSKEELLRLASEQRTGAIAALDALSDDDLDRPLPENYRMFGPSVAYLFAMLPSHWMMHAGQWVIARRQLGRPPLF